MYAPAPEGRSCVRITSQASTSESLPGETLTSIDERIELVLSLQRQLAQNVSEVITGQASMQTSILDLRQSLGLRKSVGTKEEETAEADASRLRIRASVASVGSAMSSGERTQWQGINLIDALEVVSVLDDDETDKKIKSLVVNTNATAQMRGSHLRARLLEKQFGLLRESSFMLDPHCKSRIAHDLASIIILALDVISAPVILAWDLDLGRTFNAITVFSFCFWSFDMFLNFVTGFYVDADLELQPKMIAKKYLKSWFVPDVVVILLDLMTILVGGSADSSRKNWFGILRLSKTSRFFRLARLCRLAKVSDVFDRLAGASMYFEIVVETIKPFLVIILINHMLACAWWAMGSNLPTDTGLWWVHEEVSSRSPVSYIETGFAFQYLTCTHWALMSLALGSMDVSARNSLERAFSCFCLLLGMLLFSTLISSVSSKMMQHYVKQKDKLSKLAALRRFLANKVQRSITLAAHFQANKAMSSNTGKPVTMNEVAAIATLPRSLQRRIHEELCVKHIQHPLLRWWFIIDPRGGLGLCHAAIDFVGLSAEDHLFFPLTRATGAYVMTSGVATYTIEHLGFHLEGEEVGEGRFFCEAALWCKWKHVGEFTATTGCELLSISIAGLIKCLDHDMFVKHTAIEYGRSFHDRLTAWELQMGKEPDDLAVPFTEFESILPSLPLQCRQLIGAVALSVAKQRQCSDALVREVHDGKCCLMLNWEGEVERIVSVVVLHLSREDGKILVQLGHWDADRTQFRCKLPGTKQQDGETPTDTITRLIQGPFAPIADLVTYTGVDREISWEESKRMRMTTKYLRTINYAELNCPLEYLGLTPVEGDRRSAFSRLSVSWTNTIFAKPSIPDHMEVHDLDDLDIYALADEVGKIIFVGWLSSHDMDFFTSPKGQACLEGIMENMSLEPSMLEAAKARFANVQTLGIDRTQV